MEKKKLIIGLLAFVILIAGASVLYSRLSKDFTPDDIVEDESQGQVSEEGEEQEQDLQMAPDFTVYDSDGNSVKLSDYFGKPIVLNFWAYWCGPCHREMPEFNALYEELGGDVVFLMVHVDPDTTQGRSYVLANGYDFPVAYDEKAQAAGTYGITSFPTTFFIDAEGNVRAYYVGAMNAERLQTGIDIIYTTEG
jgi:thiol-disulfide isomerase/thioredoxin